ncbi:MAG TPA: hypothetical protein VFV78_09095 [Vicinamibacterales bacterium]|nr:hypothetical protein [Vicinamibacterales bacterium]
MRTTALEHEHHAVPAFRPMPRLRLIAAAIGVIVTLMWSGAPAYTRAQGSRQLPDRLSDADFWALSEALSEPPGQFHSDNLVSNEIEFQKILPGLSDRHPSGGVYLGVGPEQNFTYIAALEPRVAFILDIRAENRGLHLLYKALFELAHSRAEFVSLLFSRPMRPSSPATAAPAAAELFAALDPAAPTEAQLSENLTRVLGVLRDRHHFTLSTRDLDGLRRAYQEFARAGVSASYSSPRMPMTYNTYADLMQVTDATGQPASYLATDARFQVVKDLEARNLVVPVIGDFSGPTALRAIGNWLRDRQATVTVFYLSNVEDYLAGEASASFCRNVATLPIDDDSDFIRSSRFGTVLHTPAPHPSQASLPPLPHRATGFVTFTDIVPKPPPPDLHFVGGIAWRPSTATALLTRTSRITEELSACR